MATNYQRGRSFEYRVRDHLIESGAVYVMRAAQSKGAVDLLVLWPSETVPALQYGCGMTEIRVVPPWLVQCKYGEHPRLSPADREELVELANRCGALAVAATAKPRQRITFTFLNQ